jgi:hypothetical protein
VPRSATVAWAWLGAYIAGDLRARAHEPQASFRPPAGLHGGPRVGWNLKDLDFRPLSPPRRAGGPPPHPLAPSPQWATSSMGGRSGFTGHMPHIHQKQDSVGSIALVV